MARQLITLLCVCAATLLSCSSSKVAGTTDETVTGLAKIYNPSGSPAAGVTVKVFAAGDTSRIPVYQTTTNKSGEYSVASVGTGVYNILEGNDTLGAFQDSMIIQKTYSTLADDTLSQPGMLLGIIRLQPEHDPRTATVQILGTDKYSNVGSDGSFVIEGLPAGKYELRTVSTLPEYTPTFTNATMQPSVSDTTRDTIAMIYTGIPVVQNLKADYDTVFGIVTLSWDTIDYPAYHDFLIYRDTGAVLTPSTVPIGSCGKCSFSDTIASFITGSATALTYRVAVRNTNFTVGNTFKDVQVAAVPVASIKFNDSLIAYLGLPCTLSAQIAGYTGGNVKYEWDIGNKGTFSASHGPETTCVIHDSISNDYQCVLRMTIENRRILLDTARLATHLKWTKISPSFLNEPFYSASISAIVQNSQIVGFVNVYDTVANKYRWECSIWRSSDGQNWVKLLDSLPAATSMDPIKPAVLGSYLCFVDTLGYLWKSTDAIVWSKASSAPLCNTHSSEDVMTIPGYHPPVLFTYRNAIYLEPYLFTGSDQLLVSNDLMHWDSTAGFQLKLMISGYSATSSSLVVVGKDGSMMQDENPQLAIVDSTGVHYVYAPADASGSESQLSIFDNAIVVSRDSTTNGPTINRLWALDKSTMSSWHPCSAPLQTENYDGEDYSMIVFNNDLFMISPVGIYKASH